MRPWTVNVIIVIIVIIIIVTMIIVILVIMVQDYAVCFFNEFSGETGAARRTIWWAW